MKKRTKTCELCSDEISLSNYEKHYKICDGSGKYKPFSNCPHCNLEFLTLSGNSIGTHIRWCVENPNRTGNINGIDWRHIQEKHNTGIFWNNLHKIFNNVSKKMLETALKLGLITKISHEFHHSDETKKIISEKRKIFLSENKDSHVWKKNEKFKSIPCEYFKNILRENLIDFVEEFPPIDNRAFSIDVAFPDKKIGIEINGNQHYNKDKTLKEYYQTRQDIIENDGWKLFQIHYSLVYKKEFIFNVIEQLKADFNFGIIDYSFYFKKDKPIKLCSCGKEIKYSKGKFCHKCSHFNRRKVERPSLLQLEIDVKEFGYSATGHKYGVSDNAIRKWINSYKINIATDKSAMMLY